MTVAHADLANAIRFLSADAVQKAKSGHPGMPMGMADVATVLFNRYLKFDPRSPRWPDRDRFVLSAGHGSMLLYSLAYLTGFEDIDIEQIKNFRQLGARTAGHPEYGHVMAAETTTGPLGQGLANAVGMALAEKMRAARYGKSVVDHFTYVIAGDGCLMEGVSQEAISLAGHHRLSKLIVFWDDNGICIDGTTDKTISCDQLARFRASRWNTLEIDGHDPEAIAAAIETARKSDRPTLIACKTVIGFGAPTLAGSEKTHGAPLGDEELAGAREKLGWPHAPFEVPEAVLATWRQAIERGADARRQWESRFGALPAETRQEFERTEDGRLPAGWLDKLNAFKQEHSAAATKVATRKASEMVLGVLTEAVPELVGGSADLTHSNLTITKATQPVTPQDASGRYIHWGVREHGMGSAMNGMALHGGFIPYGGTFLVFSDYCRPAIRMAALMGKRVVFVMTHDSIGLGEDGPTHQPIEHLASLRAMPGVLTMRPADIIETAECWAAALEASDRPSVLALSRQGLPCLRAEHTDENLSAKGAYVLAEAEGPRQVTLLATGSEVEIALKARDMLGAEGVAAAVVSMPCWELFDAQPEAYRRQVLGSGPRVAVEAMSTFGWEKYVGSRGGIVGMTGFGASAPAPALYEHFGITAEAVVAAARERL
ncbi:transketolase [Roseospirillum parvum]|uniref:Transketolase n=1 Tax=Roseospirillum parvum TaxID=83401 RepID=A0A1G7UP62_9PROT|nr:transketolase [Roseospirillum parvum]SDG49021.1 transketolase [Roseospirillum parvum]